MNFDFLLPYTDAQIIEYSASLSLADAQALRAFMAANNRPDVVAAIDKQFTVRQQTTLYYQLQAENQGKIATL